MNTLITTKYLEGFFFKSTIERTNSSMFIVIFTIITESFLFVQLMYAYNLTNRWKSTANCKFQRKKGCSIKIRIALHYKTLYSTDITN